MSCCDCAFHYCVTTVTNAYVAGKGDADIVLELSNAPDEKPETFQAVHLLLLKCPSLTSLQAVRSLYDISREIEGNSSISTVREVTLLRQSLSSAQVSLYILSNSNVTMIMCSSDSLNFTILDEYLERECPIVLQSERAEISVGCPVLGSEPDIIRYDLVILR